MRAQYRRILPIEVDGQIENVGVNYEFNPFIEDFEIIEVVSVSNIPGLETVVRETIRSIERLN